MSRVPKGLAIAFFLGLLALAPAASAQRFGGRFGGGFRGGFYGGYAGPGWGWGWYSPWYGPYAYYGGPYWGYGYGYAPHPKDGNVKIETKAKDALVYVDGGYAGQSKDLKKFSLAPGNHTIELRDPGGNVFHKEQVNVIPGKTVDIHD